MLVHYWDYGGRYYKSPKNYSYLFSFIMDSLLGFGFTLSVLPSLITSSGK